MIKLLLLCMLQSGYYATQIHRCFKMTFVDAHASCFGKHKQSLTPLYTSARLYESLCIF